MAGQAETVIKIMENRIRGIEIPDDALPDIEELHGDLRLLAEIVGIKLAIKVALAFNGTPLRIYGIKKWWTRLRDRAMRAEYDKGDIIVVDLARKYGVGERQAYNILGRVEVDERQMSLF
ncbi:MAG TPA: hypothetical protein ENK33_06340 [Desulfobacterales bacterium]|nr:hypothetical protein [Desulfobacterales bacterium]